MIEKEHLLVYGTLKKGFGLHEAIKGRAKYIGTYRVPGFIMHSLGAFPAIVPSADKDDTIMAELYEIDRNTLYVTDHIEGFRAIDSPYNFYDRKKISLDNYDPWIYYHKESTQPIVPSGEWTR